MRVEEILAAYSDAATRLDAEEMVAHFDTPFVVVRDGATEVFLNREQILDRMRDVFAAYGRAGVVSSEFTLLDVTPSGENSTLAHVRIHSSTRDGESFFTDEHLVLRFRPHGTVVAAIISSRGSRSLDDLFERAAKVPPRARIAVKEER